jgi:hypothetical protein
MLFLLRKKTETGNFSLSKKMSTRDQEQRGARAGAGGSELRVVPKGPMSRYKMVVLYF